MVSPSSTSPTTATTTDDNIPPSIPRPTQASLLPVYLACVMILAALAKGSFSEAVSGFTRFLSAFLAALGMKNLPKVGRKGAPAKAGCVAAIRAAASTVGQFGTETSNSGQSADELNKSADNLDVYFNLETSLKGAAEMVARNAYPEARTAVDKVRLVVKVVDPVIDTHPEMLPVLNPALRYLNDPHKRAGKTQKHNNKKQKALVKKTNDALLPQARDQVRGELQQQVTDRLGAVFSGDKTSK